MRSRWEADIKTFILLGLALLPALACAQEEKTWSLGVSAYAFYVPDGGDYVQPTLTADRGLFHFEARHNYENLDTSSAWLGLNYGWGEALRFDLTPMLGVVSGKTDGWAPGYKATLSWRGLTAYSEGEYVFDSQVKEDSFFYAWNELTVNPLDWLRVGFVGQRTRLYQTERNIQRGLLIGVNYQRVGVTAHVFNPDLDDPTYALSLSLSF